MGLEIVRSSTPQPVRGLLKEAVKVAIVKDEEALQQYIVQARTEYNKLPPEEIAFPRGVNGLAKYSGTDIYTKGTPLHVRGALLYNYHIKARKLTSKYELINEGEKIKYLYLKTPNTIHENVIGFVGKIPTEFQLNSYVDYDKMFEKSFIEPIKNIVDGLNWQTEKQASLAGLFS
jgi:DNA polymerase elongation subunit (family B)